MFFCSVRKKYIAKICNHYFYLKFVIHKIQETTAITMVEKCNCEHLSILNMVRYYLYKITLKNISFTKLHNNVNTCNQICQKC